MNHLTQDQLSALLDDSLAASERAACEAHLAGCEACRAELAELSALDRELGGSLTHDPGEAYFATFADRVQARIAASAANAAPPALLAARPRGGWRELFSFRRLTYVGGTLALLVTVGLAWMRFQRQDDAARALRAAAPPSAVGSRLEERERRTPSAGQVPAPVAGDEATPQAARTPALTPPREAQAGSAPGAAPERRARQVRTLANGEPVPMERVRSGEPQALAKPQGAALEAQAPSANESAPPSATAPAAARPSPAPTPATAQMKARAAAPAAPQSRAPESGRASTWGSRKSLYDAGPAPSLAKDALGRDSADGAASTLHFRGGRADELKLNLEQGALANPCGTVHDSRGQPLAGAEITLLGRTARSTRSAPDGTFCLSQPVEGDTLVILHVGFEPVRMRLTSTSALAFALEPVGTLGSKAGLVLGTQPGGASEVSFMRVQGLQAAEPESVLRAVSEARALSATARRARTAEGYERAAASWGRIGTFASGTRALDARFQQASMIREAYRVAPTPAREARLRAALAAFVAGAPRTLPERATVLRWQSELDAPAPR